MSAPFGKARREFTLPAQLQQYSREKAQLFGLLRARTTPMTIATPFLGSSLGSSGVSSGSGNYLVKLGDSMIGPIAFQHLVTSIVNPNTLDISKATNKAFTTYVTLVGAVNTILDTISGAFTPGQLLILEGTMTESFTIRDTTTTNSNIRTINGQAITLDSNDIIMFIYDDIDGGNSGLQQGCWHQITQGKSFHLGIDASSNSHYIHDELDPVLAQDVATKAYVDRNIQLVANFVGLFPIGGYGLLKETVIVFTDKNRQYTNMIASEAMAESVFIYLNSADDLMAIGGESMSQSSLVSYFTLGIGLYPNQGGSAVTVTVKGVGFTPGDTITIKFNSIVQTTVPASPIVAGNGTFSCTFTTPSGGSNTVEADDQHSISANASYN